MREGFFFPPNILAKSRRKKGPKKKKKSNLIATTYWGINKRQISVFLKLSTSISVSWFALVYGQIFYQRIIYILLNAQIVSVHLDTFL